MTLAVGISTLVDAQNADERKAVSESVNVENLRRLSAEFQEDFERQEALVLAYLNQHPDQRRSFEKNGSTYYLKRMSPDGNPVYINTKGAERMNNQALQRPIKAEPLHGGGAR